MERVPYDGTALDRCGSSRVLRDGDSFARGVRRVPLTQGRRVFCGESFDESPADRGVDVRDAVQHH